MRRRSRFEPGSGSPMVPSSFRDRACHLGVTDAIRQGASVGDAATSKDNLIRHGDAALPPPGYALPTGLQQIVAESGALKACSTSPPPRPWGREALGEAG